MSDIYAMNRDGGIMLSTAHPCPLCHAMHFFFKNRIGTTLCIHCDAKEDAHAIPVRLQCSHPVSAHAVGAQDLGSDDGRIQAA